VLQYLSVVEMHSSHPLANALVTAARNEHSMPPEHMSLTNHRDLAGEGVTGLVDGLQVHVGNSRLFQRLGLLDEVSEEDMSAVQHWAASGGTVGFMSIEGVGIVCGYCVADAVRKEAKDVVAAFHKLGIEVAMLTGDNMTAALAIGRAVGLSDECINSQLLPQEKLDLVVHMMESIRNSPRHFFSMSRNGCVLMCGDGVNDAPALAIADVGVAMGAGASLAMETADVTLLDSNLKKLLKSVRLGRRVNRTIIENIVFSLTVKIVVMGLTFAGYTSLWAAIGSDVGAMLIVTFNGMKLLPSRKSVQDGTGFDEEKVRGVRDLQDSESVGSNPSHRRPTENTDHGTVEESNKNELLHEVTQSGHCCHAHSHGHHHHHSLVPSHKHSE